MAKDQKKPPASASTKQPAKSRATRPTPKARGAPGQPQRVSHGNNTAAANQQANISKLPSSSKKSDKKHPEMEGSASGIEINGKSVSEEESENEQVTESGSSDEEGEDEEQSDDDDDSDGFESQGSSSDEDDSEEDSQSEVDGADLEDTERQRTRKINLEREKAIQKMREDGTLEKASYLHVDDLSSDDEEVRNTVGDIPLRWYEDYDHIGYDLQGKKIVKAERSGVDGIDAVIAARDDPLFRRKVYDAYNDREIILSDRDMELIRRMQAGAFAHPEFDAYPEYVDYYTSKTEIHPLSSAPEPKRRFIPSKWEAMRVMKIVKAIKEGRIKLETDESKKDAQKPYLLWKDDNENQERRGPLHIPAPKMALPGHAESYNPPEEYLFTEEEKKAWEEMDPEDREINFIPQKFNSLREVCGYEGFVQERFDRCLDLYLCPRTIKRKLNIDPESLVPQLPKPQELRPFPTTLAVLYSGHTGRVRSITVDPSGQFLASGSDDKSVMLWEIDTGRCVQQWTFEDAVQRVVWNPNHDHHVVAVSAGNRTYLIATGTGSGDQTEITNALLGGAESEKEAEASISEVEWLIVQGSTKEVEVTESNGPAKWWSKRPGSGIRIVLTHQDAVSSISWHRKGDYLATVSAKPGAAASNVFIHQISKRKTQMPFKNSHGQVQTVAFHPTKPFFFVATQRHVRVYNLVKQTMSKKLMSGAKWISSIDVHGSGDHLVMGTYDRRVCWFDLDLSSMPYKTLKYHEKAVRSVALHRHYPLMASSSDDGSIHIFHTMVYSDLLKNPLIVPLKILRGHEVIGGVGVMAVVFHPTQPWVFSAGADGTVRLYQNVHK